MTTKRHKVGKGKAHTVEEMKGAIGDASERVRDLVKRLNGLEERYERGEYGKSTHAEMWAAMVRLGEQIKGAEANVSRAEGAFRETHGKEYWQ